MSNIAIENVLYHVYNMLVKNSLKSAYMLLSSLSNSSFCTEDLKNFISKTSKDKALGFDVLTLFEINRYSRVSNFGKNFSSYSDYTYLDVRKKCDEYKQKMINIIVDIALKNNIEFIKTDGLRL